MRKLILTISMLLITSTVFAQNTADQIMNSLCNGDPECTICADFVNNNFQRCSDKYVFNPNSTQDNGDESIIGMMSKTQTDSFCGLDNMKRTCTPNNDEKTEVRMRQFKINETNSGTFDAYSSSGLNIIGGSLICNRNQCMELINYATKSAIGAEFVAIIDHKKSLCSYRYQGSDGANDTIVTENCNYTQTKRRIIFNPISIPQDKWNDKYMFIEADNNGNQIYQKLPLELLIGGIYFENIGSLGTATLVHSWTGADYTLEPSYSGIDWHNRKYSHNYTVNIRVPMDVKVKKHSYTCPNSNYPCTSNDDIHYYCTPTPCSVLTPEGNLTEEEKKPENLTPEYEDITDNGTCKPDENLYIFTPIGGKHMECRTKGNYAGANDLVAPNQCIVQEGLTNETKDSLLHGLNNTFDEMLKYIDPVSNGLGDWAVLVSPVSFVFRAIELLGEAIIRNLAEEPTEEEKNLSLLRASYSGDGSCHKIGDYCSDYNNDGMYGKWPDNTKWDLTSCARHSDLYCCYDSVIAKAFNKAAREQLPNITWGENLTSYAIQSNFKQPQPNCRGLTIDEIAKVNIDSPEFQEEMKAYVNDVLLPEMTAPGGLLDINRLSEVSKKMADDIQGYYK